MNISSQCSTVCSMDDSEPSPPVYMWNRPPAIATTVTIQNVTFCIRLAPGVSSVTGSSSSRSFFFLSICALPRRIYSPRTPISR